MKITITRGLAELKLLDSRIQKELENLDILDSYQRRVGAVAVDSRIKKEDFEKKATSDYQSLVDLISRRRKIKGLILISNATTRVSISGESLTVSEAIEKKASIGYQQKLLLIMKQQMQTEKKRQTTHLASIEQNALKLLEANYGADKKDDKDAYNAIAKPFIEQNELILIDPLDLQKKIDDLDKEIDNFLSEVDFVLSESNARTEIEV